jgi:hypothetical protein
MKKAMLFCVSLVCLIGYATMSIADPLDQYATSVIYVSSEYNDTLENVWGYNSAAKALGEPDCSSYGYNYNAWMPVEWTPTSGTGTEYISLGYGTSVYANGAVIREAGYDNNGFVKQVDVVYEDNSLYTVWAGTGPGSDGTGLAVDFSVSWSTTPYLVKGLIIYTINNADTWGAIDSVQLKGDTEAPGGTSVPEPTTMLLLGLGLIGLAGVRKRMSI